MHFDDLALASLLFADDVILLALSACDLHCALTSVGKPSVKRSG